MADNMSSEVYETLEKDLEFYFKHEQNLTNEVKMEKLRDIRERIRGVTYILGMEDKPLIEFRKKVFDIERNIIEVMKSEQIITNTGNLTIDVDVTDAIKGLKAVQREARKTVAALKEVEEYKADITGKVR